MNYSYKFRLTKKDMWLYYLVDRYSSLAGVVQIIFTVSMFLLLFSKWVTLGLVLKVLAILGCLLFTVIQPFAFWLKAVKAANPNVPETEISFNEIEMIIQVNSHVQKIKYDSIVQVIKKPFMLLIQPDKTHLYILSNRVLGNSKKELYEYLKSKILG